ncbi:hypothetical protein [Xanthomonas sp. MUS 060]|uniref:hypothetical protein n=1 Tax=Xanthomonas sp. MUS 060 TaxID=1588031 RepID=UPI0019104299|nr:hypothetical protein [Xanthomonas sp. MUS 060]
METFVPLTFSRRGIQRAAAEQGSVHDVTLIEGLARAFYWQHLLDIGAMPSGSAIARAENLDQSVVNESLRMNLLAPDIVERFMAGKQPPHWQHLLDIGAMPSGSAIARAENLDQSVVNESLRMNLLAPDIVERFMAGKQPPRLTLMWFQRNRLMVDWYAQRQLMASLEDEA